MVSQSVRNLNQLLIIRKSPFRLSPTRKANLRKRLRRVDDVIAAVAESGVETRSLSRALALPKEHEMEARGGSRPRNLQCGARLIDRQVYNVQSTWKRVQKECPQSTQMDKGQSHFGTMCAQD